MTQGLLSITYGGTVLRKIVTGADGQVMPELARRLRTSPTLDHRQLLLLCGELDLDVLVQVSASECYRMENGKPELLLELPELYQIKFTDPGFNPRWEAGTAAYVELVELGPDGLLSPEETRVMDGLVTAWNAWVKLEVLHSDATDEFRRAIHSAQYLLMARPVQRAFNQDLRSHVVGPPARQLAVQGHRC